MATLHGEFHDGTNNVAARVFERLDGLAAGHAGLRHDKLNIFRLHARLIHLHTYIVSKLVFFPSSRLSISHGCAGPEHRLPTTKNLLNLLVSTRLRAPS